MCIATAVGRDCKNNSHDVKTVQILLNMNLDKLPELKELSEDGTYGKATQGGIDLFQRQIVGSANPDGKVDPGGRTLLTMAKGIPSFCERVLQGIYVNADDKLVNRYWQALADKMPANGIDTHLRVAHFLAQVGHESGELRYCEEIATGDAYEGRKDLGNSETGDGRRFKGRGLIQLTGRSNYVAYSTARGIDYTSDEGASVIATDPDTAVDVACWFWTTHNLNELADKDDVTSITKRINGGLNGFEDRKAKLLRARFFVAG